MTRRSKHRNGNIVQETIFLLACQDLERRSAEDLGQRSREKKDIGTLLTRVRKSCKGRVASPDPADQVTAEAEKAGAVRTKPANSAAAESTAPTRLSPLAGLLAKREGADRPRSRSFFFPTPEIRSGGCSCWLAVWHQPLSG